MENTATSDSQSATPSGSTTSTGATPTASTGATPTKPAMSLEDALARIADLEKHATNKEEEAKRHGKKLKAYEEAEEQQRLAAMSDLEKANKRVADAEQLHQQAQAQIKQYQQQLATAYVKLAAQAKGIIDPEMAALAIQSGLEYGEDGLPTNIDKALDALIKSKPYLAPPKPAEQPAEPAPPTPAQTAQATRPPAIPAMHPGRTNNAPAPGKIPSWNDIYKRS
jgi:hypothetical protein